ncbi:hypothetical protein FB45DRAFT_1037725 [Roridomyces roridus]|uniref:F-box domain-containing protein n=1 Tax=Roridomyces roridus TaxID=1738132 RepID=A0AAD7B5N3_9AGAR|nr:hypothetical protein FB45DRAFT_1037725 [Roridomyces roridus]
MDSEAASSSKPRATRASSKRKAEATTTVDAPAPKRTKITKKKGSLQRLLDISLDVLFEILGHLQPLDVLRLGRVSKEFRRLLFHKSSISIWKSGLANVPGLPPCPPSMTEPQWVSLVFDQTCQVCFKIARKVDWRLFIRICTKCTKPSLVPVEYIYGLTTTPEPVLLAQLVLTRTESNRTWKHVSFSPEFTRVKALYEAISNREEQAKFVQERKDIVKDLKARALLCEEWTRSITDNRSEELADLKEERFKAISAKLTDLGWGDELEELLPCDSLRFHKSVKQPTRLTDRTWNAIKPDLIKYMEQMKVERLARELVVIIVKRKDIAGKVLCAYKRSQLPWNEVMPTAADFCLFPEIAKIVQSPLEVVVNEQTFEQLSDSFPIMGNGLFLGGSIPLQPLYWPRVLEHGCMTQDSSLWSYMKRSVPWRADVLSVDEFTKEVVEKIVAASGLDPKTATVEEMDAADVRLACHLCATRTSAAFTSEAGPATVNGFSWRNAVLHEGDNHHRNPTAWHKLDAEETEAVRAMEKVVLEKARIAATQDTEDVPMHDAPAEDGGNADERKEQEQAPLEDESSILPASNPEVAWCCAHCLETPQGRGKPMILDAILGHLSVRHDTKLGSAVLNKDFYRSPAAPELYTEDHFPAPSLDVAVLPKQPQIAPREVPRYPNNPNTGLRSYFEDMFGGYDSYSDSEDGHYGDYDDY